MDSFTILISIHPSYGCYIVYVDCVNIATAFLLKSMGICRLNSIPYYALFLHKEDNEPSPIMSYDHQCLDFIFLHRSISSSSLSL